MEAEVIYYCEDHDYVDFAALSDHFGFPEDVAKDFLSELGINAVNKSNKSKQYILYFIALVAVCVIIFAAVVETYANYKQQKALDVHYIESITYEGDVEQYATSPTYWVTTSKSGK